LGIQKLERVDKNFTKALEVLEKGLELMGENEGLAL